MRRATGFSSYLNSTQSQEEHLKQWTEARRRERRQAEMDEEMQMMKLEGIMTGVEICSAVLAGIGILALLIYHLNWWVVPALASAIFLGWIIRSKEDRNHVSKH